MKIMRTQTKEGYDENGALVLSPAILVVGGNWTFRARLRWFYIRVNHTKIYLPTLLFSFGYASWPIRPSSPKTMEAVDE